MATTVLEVETKYDVGPDAALPDLTVLPGVGAVEPGPSVLLSATYFDTADLALLRSAITLRRRAGGADAGWHLKLPVDGDRFELQHPLGPPTGGVPGPLLAVVRGIVRERPLVPVARIETQRETVGLRGIDGRLGAEVCDDLVTAQPLAGRAGPPLTWREWEVELYDRAAGAVVTEALVAAGAVPSARRAKLERVLDVTTAVPSPSGPPAALAPDAPAAAVLAPYLADRIGQFLAVDPLVRADVPDAVHRMRVAGRRVNAVLAAYARHFEAPLVRRQRKHLRWIVGELGRARDLEVLQARLEPLLADGTRGWDTGLADEHREAHRHALDAMVSPRYFALADALADLAADPPWSDRAARPAVDTLTKAVLKEARRLEHAVAVTRPVQDAEERARRLHKVRRRAKRLRYAVEAVEPVVGAPALRTRHALADVQEVLGSHHDTVVARQKIIELAGQHPDLDVGPPLAELDRDSQAAEDAYRTALGTLEDRLREWPGRAGH